MKSNFFSRVYWHYVYTLNFSFLYWEKAKLYYFDRTGKEINYNKPTDLNEKLMWLERYWQHPLKTECSDKYLVRNYLKRCGLEQLLVPLIAVYNNPDEIDYIQLPQKFVLKCNHGSHYNIICTDKNAFDIEMCRTHLDQWIKEDYSKKYMEIHYRDIERRIICEELISETAPIEYQFWCINGKPKSILACRKNHNGTYDSCSMSLDWIQLYDRKDENASCLTKPKQLAKLIEYAEKLSKPFPFVRADFYVVEGRIYFAELTFSPNGNVLSSYKKEFINQMGKELELPVPWKKNKAIA